MSQPTADGPPGNSRTSTPAGIETEPVIENLPDGCVRVTLGSIATTCSSHHLVPDKIKQLQRYHQQHSKVNPQQAVKHLRTHSDATGATDIEAMNNRVLALEWLYRLQGRKDAKPGLRSTYTGLWESIH